MTSRRRLLVPTDLSDWPGVVADLAGRLVRALSAAGGGNVGPAASRAFRSAARGPVRVARWAGLAED